MGRKRMCIYDQWPIKVMRLLAFVSTTCMIITFSLQNQWETILLGITRDAVIKLAQRELGLIVRERQIDRTELYIADEVFLCGTGAQIAPVISIDHNPVGNGEIGPISQRLQDLYFDVV